jgi:predicted XRE-type DNA-binding protein
MMRQKTKLVRSSGNVFKDLGFDSREAEHLLIRSDLLIRLQGELAKRDLKQADAARLLGITQPRVSDIVRGRLDLFSTDGLIDLLARAGVRVRVVVSRRKVA